MSYTTRRSTRGEVVSPNGGPRKADKATAGYPGGSHVYQTLVNLITSYPLMGENPIGDWTIKLDQGQGPK
jgi:hypothetical protein